MAQEQERRQGRVSYAIAGVILIVAGVILGRWLLHRPQARPLDLRDAYQLYIDSAQWREVRLTRLTIDRCRCQGCGTGLDLHVHHLTYERFGNEDVYTDLVTVCGTCHRRIHEAHRAAPHCTLAYITTAYLRSFSGGQCA